MKSIQRPFLSIIDLIVEPWSSKKLPIYNDFFSKLKDDVEKDSILLLTIFFQVPKLSYNSTKILCSKYSLNFREIPDNLPRKLFIDFFTLIQVIASKNSRSYTRVVLICSSSLPKNVLNPFLIEILKYNPNILEESIDCLKRVILIFSNSGTSEKGIQEIFCGFEGPETINEILESESSKVAQVKSLYEMMNLKL